MRRFRSLLIDDVNIRAPGLHIMSLAVHRHLPELAAVAPHRHRWCQALLYLSGEGRQTVALDKIRIAAGSVVVIPPGVFHAFARAGGRTPLCLAIDFRLRDARRRNPALSVLNRSELAQLRQHLAELHRLRAEPSGGLPCEGAAVVLQTLVTLLRSAGWLAPSLTPAPARKGRAILALLDKLDPASSLTEIIRSSGYQRDYLNHLIKRETGLTLGQYRAQRRLAQAKRLLGEGLRVAEVAAAAGLPDQNYFARWFRRQTGLAPSRWNRGRGASESA